MYPIGFVLLENPDHHSGIHLSLSMLPLSALSNSRIPFTAGRDEALKLSTVCSKELTQTLY